MTHLPFIVASYGIFVAVALIMAIDGGMRLRSATRRLDALDRRKAAP
jgi:uncharacterized integral membrane protein